MSINYQKTDNDGYIHKHTDAGTYTIPVDEQNGDYTDYLQWVADGNTIDDYVPPPTPTVEEQVHNDFIAGISTPFMQALLEETGQTQAIKDRILANAKLPEWDATKTNYKHGDKVRWIGFVWECIDDGTMSEPDWVKGDWEAA